MEYTVYQSSKLLKTKNIHFKIYIIFIIYLYLDVKLISLICISI